MTAPANPWASDPTAQNVQPPDAYVAIGFVDEEPISAAYLNWALSNVYGVNLCITHSTGSEICIEDDGDIQIHGISDVFIAGDTQLRLSSVDHRQVIDPAGGFWRVLRDTAFSEENVIEIEYVGGGATYVTVSADEHSIGNAAGSATWLYIDEDVVSSGIGFYASAASPLHSTRYGYTSQTVKIDLSPRTGGYNSLIASNSHYQFGRIDVSTSTVLYGPLWVRPVPLDQSGSQAAIVWRLNTLVVEYYDGSNTTEDFYVKIRKMDRDTGAVTDVGGTATITPANTAAFIVLTVTLNVNADLDTYTYFCEIYNKALLSHSGSEHLTDCRQVFKRISLTCTKYAAD